MLEASRRQPGLPVQEAWREVEGCEERGGEGGPWEKKGRAREREGLGRRRGEGERERTLRRGEGGPGGRRGGREAGPEGKQGTGVERETLGGRRGEGERGERAPQLGRKSGAEKNVRKPLMEKTQRFSYANCGLAKLRVQKRNLSWGVMGARAESPATEGSGGGAHSI